MQNVPSRAPGEAMPEISRRNFLRSTTGAVVTVSVALSATTSIVMARLPTPEVDPILAEIKTHREAFSVFDNAARGASDDYLDGEEFQALSDIEIVAWNSLIETQPTTLAGLAVFSAYVLHSPALHGDMDQIRAILMTVAVASAKFAHPGGEAGR